MRAANPLGARRFLVGYASKNACMYAPQASTCGFHYIQPMTKVEARKHIRTLSHDGKQKAHIYELLPRETFYR